MITLKGQIYTGSAKLEAKIKEGSKAPTGGGEDIPEYNEVEDFELDVSGLDTELEISYSVSEKVALPAGRNILAYIEDENFTPSNIKNGVTIFGVTGEYEGEGGGNEPTEEELTFTGNLDNAFRSGVWTWFVEKYGHKMKTVDITSAIDTFKSSSLEEVPFDLNFERMDANFHYLGDFVSGSRLKTVPKMPNFRASTSYVNRVVQGAQYVREVPEDLGEEFDWRYFDNESSRTITRFYWGCYSMRKPNLKIFKRDFSTNLCYGYGFCQCMSLDELVGLPIPLKSDIYEVTANKLGGMVTSCCRLKRLTFEMNNGVPYKVKWSNQLLDLTDGVGYAPYSSYISNITSRNSGITLDKKVTDTATYAELKNDPDWFTEKMAYSRYNHTSAVETINSLPDTSEYIATSGGTNTIKFRGACGSSTDGGAISNLTEAEIAVATAKGWTVTLI